ncbi:MAG: ATP-binding cassette domain-containing protein [Geminicoccaceae bacterium]
MEAPAIVGMMGPNGSGKTTLFELITGSNRPSAGRVTVLGQDIHKVRTDERDRLAIHYHQSYQVRHFRSFVPNLPLHRAASDYPMVHLFDEPQFNTQDGYIGFMLAFFRRLRAEGRLVFLCVHPNERFHLEILQEICERFIFVHKGTVTQMLTGPAGPPARPGLSRRPGRYTGIISFSPGNAPLAGWFGKSAKSRGAARRRARKIPEKAFCCSNLMPPGFVCRGLGSFVESVGSIVVFPGSLVDSVGSFVDVCRMRCDNRPDCRNRCDKHRSSRIRCDNRGFGVASDATTPDGPPGWRASTAPPMSPSAAARGRAS